MPKSYNPSILVIISYVKMFCKALMLFLLTSLTKSEDHKFKTMKDFYSYFQSKLDVDNDRNWKIGKLIPENLPYNQVVSMTTSVKIETPIRSSKPKQIKNIAEIPDTFDATKKWPACLSITKMQNQEQSNCSFNWAQVAIDTITDRLCISSGGKMKPKMSVWDILRCCNFCFKEDGCNGGNPYRAWEYWVNFGLISKDAEAQFKNCTTDGTCKNICIKREATKFFGIRAFKLPPDPKQVKTEIMRNGPVQAVLKIYQDIFLYKSGVYEHKIGNLTGYGTVKIIGWGVDNGKPYWLVTNPLGSLGIHVGPKNDDNMKLLQGVNECGLLDNVFGGQIAEATARSVHVINGNVSKFCFGFHVLLAIVGTLFFLF